MYIVETKLFIRTHFTEMLYAGLNRRGGGEGTKGDVKVKKKR